MKGELIPQLVHPTEVRWGILGTSRVAWRHFLPGLRAAGGRAALIASREPARAARYASDHGIERATSSYDDLIADKSVDVVYVALPNAFHAEWCAAALQAGKAVLCEKPLCLSVSETAIVLDVAHDTGRLLWEAFVFPFHRQMHVLKAHLDDGVIGPLREIQCNFHVPRDDRLNIRYSAELGGGALNDLGCYCIHLSTFLLGSEPLSAVGVTYGETGGVDEEAQAIICYPGGKRLSFSCGMIREYDPFTRLIGARGEIRLTNPYHPASRDSLTVRSTTESWVEHRGEAEPTFAAAIRHINAAVRGEVSPRHLAIDSSMKTAVGLSLVRAARPNQNARIGTAPASEMSRGPTGSAIPIPSPAVP